MWIDLRRAGGESTRTLPFRFGTEAPEAQIVIAVRTDLAAILESCAASQALVADMTASGQWHERHIGAVRTPIRAGRERAVAARAKARDARFR